jgi:phosphate transporter
MKFGKQLELALYQPWQLHYLNYARLKRAIKRDVFLANTKGKGQGSLVSRPSFFEDESKFLSMSETTPLMMKKDIRDTTSYSIDMLSADVKDEEDFGTKLAAEIKKVNTFFKGKKAELVSQLQSIISKSQDSLRRHHAGGVDANDVTRLRKIYQEHAILISFCNLNETAVTKITKKFDKMMALETSNSVKQQIKDMDFMSKRGYDEFMNSLLTLISRDKLLEWSQEVRNLDSSVGLGLFPSVRLEYLALAIVLFAISLAIPLIHRPPRHEKKHELEVDQSASSCLAVLVLAVTLWVTEAIPYYTTAIIIVPLIVILDILKHGHDSDVSLSRSAAANNVISHLFSTTSILLLGGYTISSALSRCQIEDRMSSLLQKYLGERPLLFLLAMMLVGFTLSIFLSNHTAPILCATFVNPILKELPTDSPYAKCLLLAIAMGCNFGGFATPISSLQNALAVRNLADAGYNISFSDWMIVSLPLSLVGIFLTWLFMLFIYQPYAVKRIPVVVCEQSEFYTTKNIVTLTASLVTVVAFTFSSQIQPWIGDISIISLLYVAFMFGSGLLTPVDFNTLPWHTLFLLGGGSVLGEAVKSSGLLEGIAHSIMAALPIHNTWLAMLCVFIFAFLIASFISHTVRSLTFFSSCSCPCSYSCFCSSKC